MAVTLVGEVVNSCDAITGFTTGNISGDDDFVQGTGAIGQKISATTTEMYTTSLGATAPYNFASGGGEFGYHIIMWFNTKTPVASSSGLRIVVGNGTSRGQWYVEPSGFYKGGFITRVVDAASAFDVIAAGTWTLGGNPGQLTNVTQMGGVFETTTSIMGSFNNCQLDQMTIGLGVRVDAGTVGTPNTFETVRAADEDTNFWGWWSSKVGAIVGQGKLYIGPSTGSATSVFSDEGVVVIFPDVGAGQVASGFYEIATRGAGTDVTLVGCFISAENPSAARWGLTIDSTTNSYSDTNSVYSGFGTLSLNSTTTLTGVKLDGGQAITQNSASLDGCQILNAATADGVAFITANDIESIQNCDFTFSDGHAIELTSAHPASPTEITFTGNTFTGYGGTAGSNLTANSGSTDAAIYNNSGKDLIINISGGSNISVRNGAGATTTVQISVPLEINGVTEGTRCSMIGSGGAEDGVELLSGYANSSGVVSGSFGGSTPQNVIIKARNSGIINAAIMEDNGTSFTNYTSDAREAVGANDVTLLPSTISTNDAFYFGGISQFGCVLINVSTAGTTYVGTWEYWNGSWTALSGVSDGTNAFQTLGRNKVDFTVPSDWATTTINSQGPYYYIRFRVTSGGGTQPFAEEISLKQTTKYLPFTSTGTIASTTGLTTTAVWIEDTIAI